MKCAVLVFATCMLSGCIGVHRHSDSFSCPPATATGPNAGTIRAATQLAYLSDRARLIKAVAGRDDLTDSEQCALIDAVARTDLYLSDRSDILLTLASNPRFCINARNDLGARLSEIDLYESDRVRIVEAMDASAHKAVR